MPAPTLQKVRKAYEQLDYRIFDGLGPSGESRDLDLNLFGWRSDTSQANAFDDWVGVFWREPLKKQWVYRVWPATTDPGRHYLQNPLNVAGTAILATGQHRSSHRLGQHQNKYAALVQNTSLPVYRDRNKDDVIDLAADSVQVGLFGINIHRASAFQRSKQVDRWSAGCQVLADPTHFAELMDICTEAAQLWGPTFTYTLLSAADLDKFSVGKMAPATNVSVDAQSPDEILKYAAQHRPSTHTSYEGLAARTALEIAEKIIGRIEVPRLGHKAPNLLKHATQGPHTADRLNRDTGPAAAQLARYLRWETVDFATLKNCQSVLDFLRVCYNHLAHQA